LATIARGLAKGSVFKPAASPTPAPSNRTHVEDEAAGKLMTAFRRTQIILYPRA
jgi:hypothetical protein